MPGNASGDRLTISELSELSGVKVPTIHHYRKLGLLPDLVRIDAHRFGYDTTHLEALRLIRLLRERRSLSLKRIGEVLPGLIASEEAFRPEMWDDLLAEPLERDDVSRVREELVTEARRAFNDKGFAGVSVEELCDAVGVAKGTFYRFFPSKQEVFLAAVASVGDVVGAAAAGGDRRRSGWFDEAVGPYVPLLLESSVRALHGDADAATATAQVMDRLVAVAEPLRTRAKRGTGGPDDPAVGRRRLADAVQQQIEAGIRTVLSLRRAIPTPRA